MFRIKINDTIIHEPDDKSTKRLSSGKIVDEVNCISSFTFTIPVSNPYFSAEIHDRTDSVIVINTNTHDYEFEGCILDHYEIMDANGKLCKKVIAESYLGYLCDSIQMYHNYLDHTPEQFLQAILDAHNAQVSPRKRIRLGYVNIERSDYSASKTTAYRNTLEEIKVNLIERLGGEIRVRKFNGMLYLDYFDRIGDDCNTTIELARNMKSLTIQSDTANIVTRLIPLGAQLNEETAERLTISSVNDGKPYIDDAEAIEKYGIIVGTAEFDHITLPENLIDRAREYFSNNNRLRKAYSVQVLDLSVLDPNEQGIKCGNSYLFINKFFDLFERLRVTRRVLDIYKPYTPELQIGDKTETVTDIAARTAHLIEYDLPKQKYEILTSAKNIASSLIRAGFKGHVIANDEEICIMDTADKATATKVWRFDLGGFGFSNSGYDGTYSIAMTMDGGFNADFITAGIIRGIEFINGNGKFHVHPDGTVDAGALNITGGSINIRTDSETTDIITLNSGIHQSRLSPYNLLISKTDNGRYSVLAADGIFGNSSEGERTFSINSSNGDISTQGKVYANDVYYKNSDNSLSVKDQINSLQGQINAIWNVIT